MSEDPMACWIDSHGGTHYYDPGAAARHIIETAIARGDIRAPEARVEEGGPGSGACPDEPGIRSHPQGIGTPPVEDFHAKLAAEMLSPVSVEILMEDGMCYTSLHEEWAARVKELGDRRFVDSGRCSVSGAPAEAASPTESMPKDVPPSPAQANVEEKKAAFLEAAMAYCHHHTRPNPHGDHVSVWNEMANAYRALVESEKKEEA